MERFFISLFRELRETALSILTPLPFLLLFVYAVESVTSPFLFFLALYFLFAFAIITLHYSVAYIKSSFKKGWDAADPSNVKQEEGPLGFRIKILAKQWYTPEKEEEDYKPIQERKVEPLLPGVVYGVLNGLVSIFLYFLFGWFLSLLAEFGHLQSTLEMIESSLKGPEGTFLTQLSNVTALRIVLESALGTSSIKDTIFLAILLLVPGYFAIHAARQLSYSSKQAHILFLKEWHKSASILRHEVTGVLFLFVFYTLLII